MAEAGLKVWKIEKRENIGKYGLEIYLKQEVWTFFSGLFVYAGGLKYR